MAKGSSTRTITGCKNMSLPLETGDKDKCHCSLLDVQDNESFKALARRPWVPPTTEEHEIVANKDDGTRQQLEDRNDDSSYMSIDGNDDFRSDKITMWMSSNFKIRENDIETSGGFEDDSDVEEWLADISKAIDSDRNDDILSDYTYHDDELFDWLGEDYKHGFTCLFDEICSDELDDNCSLVMPQSDSVGKTPKKIKTSGISSQSVYFEQNLTAKSQYRTCCSILERKSDSYQKHSIRKTASAVGGKAGKKLVKKRKFLTKVPRKKAGSQIGLGKDNMPQSLPQ